MTPQSDSPGSSRLVSDPERHLRWTRDLLSDINGENLSELLETLATLLLLLEVVGRRSSLPALGIPSDGFGLARPDLNTPQQDDASPSKSTDRGERVMERRLNGGGPGADNGTSERRLWVEFVRTTFIGLSATGAPLASGNSPLPIPKSLRSEAAQALSDLENSTSPVEVYARLANLLSAQLSLSERPLLNLAVNTSGLQPLPKGNLEEMVDAHGIAAVLPPTHRQIVSTILSHHVSPTFSDPTSHDTALLASIWPDCAENRSSVSAESLSPSPASPNVHSAFARLEPDSDGSDYEDVKSLRTGIREARAAITRTDDKLRWLLGANYQPGCQETAVKPAGSATRKRRVVPTLLDTSVQESSGKVASIASPTLSSASISSATSSRFGLAHFRNHSAASSTRPLLRHQRSVSTGRQSSGGGSGAEKSRIDPSDVPPLARPQAGLHRKRSLSTGQLPDGFHTDRQTWRFESRHGLPPLGADTSDVATRSPPSATLGTSEKPFGNLAPAFVSSFDASCSVSTREAAAFSRNTLTEQQRRELVRRSKKLEGFFGVPFKEEAAQRVLVHSCTTKDDERPQPEGTAADASFPLAPTSSLGSSSVLTVEPISPRSFSPHTGARPSRSPDPRSNLIERLPDGSKDQLAAPLMRRSSSSPSHRSPSFSSSITSNARSQSTSPPRRFSTFERESQARERDERRKKLEKVRRFLGERVPADLVVACDAADSVIAAQQKSLRGHGKAASGTWRRGRKKGFGLGGKDDVPTTAETQSGPVPGSWRFAQPGDFAPFEGLSRRTQPQEEVPGVAALSKARKLENLFGELPPVSLYRPNGCGGTLDKPIVTHHRAISDVTTSYSPFRPDAKVGQWGQADAHRWQSKPGRSRAADNYRQSIASLSYVAEQDPAALEEVMRVYASSHEPTDDRVDAPSDSCGTIALEPISPQDGEEEDCSAPEAATMTRSLSAQSVRAVKQAQKLSQMLGTTKGEVWKLLLGDLEAAILDDDSLDQEDREEVLAKLEQLRRTKSFARPRPS